MKHIKNKHQLSIVLFVVFLYITSLCTVVHADDATIRGSGYIGDAPVEETKPVDKIEKPSGELEDDPAIAVVKTNTGDNTSYNLYERIFIVSGVVVVIWAMYALLKKEETV